MKLVTRNVDYAVRALCFMAAEKKHKQNGVVSVSELVSRLNVPRPFLRKILQILNNKGVLNSQKGKGGGFELVVVPEKIYLADLIEAFHGPLKLNECCLMKNICSAVRTCALKGKIDSIERRVIKELKTINIKSLLSGRTRAKSLTQ